METLQDTLNARTRHLISFRKIIAMLLRLLGAFAVFLVAWSFFDSHFPPVSFFDMRALMLAGILLAAGILDRAKGIVPMEITYPLMLAGIVRAIVLSDPSFFLYWFALAIIYLCNVIGGGDVKLLMGMFGLFPHFEFFVVMEIVIIATHLPIVMYRHLHRAANRMFVKEICTRIHIRAIEMMTGQTTTQELARQVIAQRPSDVELSRRGDRLAIVFSFAGILYLFLATPAGLNWHL